jgi:hypothetical protein
LPFWPSNSSNPFLYLIRKAGSQKPTKPTSWRVNIMAYAGPTESAAPFEDTIPSRFSGWHYCTWTLADLRQVAGAVGLLVPDGIEKRDLYQLIVELRPEPSSLTSAEARAIQTIKGARLVSKPTTRNNTTTVRSGNGAKVLTAPTRKKRRQSARYAAKSRKRRLSGDVVDHSSEEAATQTLLESHTKTCPNQACSVTIWKDGGCDHMTCAYINVYARSAVSSW